MLKILQQWRLKISLDGSLISHTFNLQAITTQSISISKIAHLPYKRKSRFRGPKQHNRWKRELNRAETRRCSSNWLWINCQEQPICSRWAGSHRDGREPEKKAELSSSSLATDAQFRQEIRIALRNSTGEPVHARTCRDEDGGKHRCFRRWWVLWRYRSWCNRRRGYEATQAKNRVLDAEYKRIISNNSTKSWDSWIPFVWSGYWFLRVMK